MDILKKSRGKSVAIKIDDDIRAQIKAFKDRLIEMSEYDELRDIDIKTIQFIINELDEYDRNILIAFYAVADQSPSKLGRMLGVSPNNIIYQLKKIQTYVRNRIDNDSNNSGISN